MTSAPSLTPPEEVLSTLDQLVRNHGLAWNNGLPDPDVTQASTTFWGSTPLAVAEPTLRSMVEPKVGLSGSWSEALTMRSL